MNKPRLHYFKAILWFVMSLIVGCTNDAIMKYVGTYIGSWQVTFFRCFFGAGTVFLLMCYRGFASFQTSHPWLHVIRGVLLVVAMGLWGRGVQEAPITTATLISFTVPIFVLLLAPVFLKERVTWPMWGATLLSFGGIVLVLQPSNGVFCSASVLFVLAASVFGLLDIINKKYVTKEPLLCMLFYPALTATVLLFLPAIYVGTMPPGHTWPWLLVLGIGNNLILYCLLKAFALTSVSSLAPFRYLELLISVGVGYLFFQELPHKNSYWGTLIIIPCTLFIVYNQRQGVENAAHQEK
mmetsp:Transcript_9898/g.22860  ORF Transcript_9898/g.22860 Transcript_9898/m.22860 type:complete len:296 (-) Transcript_9898:1897-2784(-)